MGDSRKALVDGLVGAFEEVCSERRPRWVSLEAPPGWGKTRVGRELYARLAAGQDELLPYWPAVIEDPVRKTVEPREFVTPPYALPEYLWWGISCSARRDQESPSLLLEGDVRRLSRHGDYWDEAIKGLPKEPGRWKQVPWRRLASALAGEGLSMAASKGVEHVVGAALPGVGALVSFARWGHEKAKDRLESKQALASPTEFSDEPEEDIVDETVNRLSRVASAGFPLVMLVEDIHDADEVLMELLDKLLRRHGSLLVVTTGLPERIEGTDANRSLVALMESHADRLRRVKHDAPAGEGFPQGAGLQALEEDARRVILHRLLPDVDVEAATEQALLKRYVNPLALELFCRWCSAPEILSEFRNVDGVLEIPAAEIDDLPREVHDLYEGLWGLLPNEVKISLAVAWFIAPASINADAAGGEDLWTAPVLHDVLENLAYSRAQAISAEKVRAALEGTSSAHSWVRAVDDYLRAFVEVPQKAIAHAYGEALLNLSLKDKSESARRQILTQLARTLLADTELAATRNVARCTLALHAEGFITDDADAARAIAALLADLEGKPRELPERIRLYAEFNRLDPTDIPTTTALDIRHHGATAHGQAGQVNTAIAAFGELLTDGQRLLGVDHPDTLTTRSNLARWLGESGRVEEAVSAFGELLVDMQRVLGVDHPDTLTTRNNLASMLARSGRVEEAVSAFGELLVDMQRLLGADHPDTLTTRNNLASWLGESGRVEEAVSAFGELLVDMQRVLGVDHPDTLTTRNNLASMLARSGRVEEAVSAFGELLTDQQRLLGADHPDTLTTRNNLASWLGESGRVEEAVSAFGELLTDQQRLLGADHPDTLTTRNNLAFWLARSGRVEEAVSAFGELLTDQQRLLGADHPDTLTTRSNLARWLGESGRVEEAVSAFGELLTDRQRLLGADHPDTLTTRNNLASMLARSGRVEEAVSAFGELLTDRQRLLGADHPDTLTTRNNLASWLGESGRVEEAVSAFGELLVDMQRVLGVDHPDTLTTRNNLAYMLARSGRVEEAVSAFGELLTDQQRLLGADHPDTLTTRNNLAYMLGESGRVEEAVSAFGELLTDQQRLLGADHPDTLTTRNNLAYMLGESGRVGESGPVADELDSSL